MRLTKSAGILAASLVAVALTSTACSSSSSGGSTASAKNVAVSQEQINAQPRSALAQGGTLTLPMEEWSSQWNVYSTNGNVTGDTQTVMTALLPELFHFSANGTPTYDPDYLTGEPTTATVGGKFTTTYELNPKAVWSDGTPVTYKDFVANWKALNGATAAYAPSSTVGYQQISNVAEGKNPYEVVVSYSTPFHDWKSLFYPLYPASEYSTPTAFNNDLLKGLGLSAGPFVASNVSQTDQTVTLAPNPKWWGDQALLSSIVFKYITNNDQAQAFANGEIDSVDVGPDPVGFKTIKAVKNSVVLEAGAPWYRQLTLNGGSTMLSDLRVRQAVVQSIDRTAIAKSDLAGLPTSQQLVQNHFVMPNQADYQDNTAGIANYSPSSAESLLSQAGWTLQSGATYRSDAGKELDLKMLIPCGVAAATNESTLMTAMLKQVGIKLTTSCEDNPFFTDVTAGKFDLTVFSSQGTDFPLTSFSSSYFNESQGNWGYNYSRVGSSTIDNLMNKAAGSTDDATAYKYLDQADAAIWQEAVQLPLYQRPQIFGQVGNLANYGAFGLADTIWQNIGFTK